MSYQKSMEANSHSNYSLLSTLICLPFVVGICGFAASALAAVCAFWTVSAPFFVDEALLAVVLELSGFCLPSNGLSSGIIALLGCLALSDLVTPLARFGFGGGDDTTFRGDGCAPLCNAEASLFTAVWLSSFDWTVAVGLFPGFTNAVACGTGTEDCLLLVGLLLIIAGLATIFLRVGSLDFTADSIVFLPC